MNTLFQLLQLRLTHQGTYQLGLATAQCCYAPEFRTTAPGEVIIVRE